MQVTIDQDIYVVKHEVEHKDSDSPYHTFGVWYIDVSDGAYRHFCQTFEGDFMSARSECRNFLDSKMLHAHFTPVLWIEKEDEIYVCE
jgi:hypothetical protein